MIGVIVTVLFWAALGANVFMTIQNYRAFKRWSKLNHMLHAICVKAMLDPAMRWTVTKVRMEQDFIERMQKRNGRPD